MVHRTPGVRMHMSFDLRHGTMILLLIQAVKLFIFVMKKLDTSGHPHHYRVVELVRMPVVMDLATAFLNIVKVVSVQSFGFMLLQMPQLNFQYSKLKMSPADYVSYLLQVMRNWFWVICIQSRVCTL